MSIQNKAMLVQLNISTWTARKFDPQVTKDVESRYSAINSGRYNKILIAAEYLGNIQKCVSAARKYHYENTLPWFDNGSRLLPAAQYLDYVKKMEEFKTSFEWEIQRFVSMYPDYKNEAYHRLNGMFSEEDYPELQTLKAKYAFGIQITPVPDAQDFRVEIAEADLENIRQNLKEQLEQSSQGAMLELWNRLYAVVEHMVERLSNEDNIFKNSMIGNIDELCQILPQLNVLDDPNLNWAVNEVKDKLATLSPDSLRNDPHLRSTAAVEAQKILAKLKDYIPAA